MIFSSRYRPLRTRQRLNATDQASAQRVEFLHRCQYRRAESVGRVRRWVVGHLSDSTCREEPPLELSRRFLLRTPARVIAFRRRRSPPDGVLIPGYSEPSAASLRPLARPPPHVYEGPSHNEPHTLYKLKTLGPANFTAGVAEQRKPSRRTNGPCCGNNVANGRGSWSFLSETSPRGTFVAESGPRRRSP